jgi:hypothetical protein
VGKEQENGNNKISGLGVREEGWDIGSEGGRRRARGRKIREKQDRKKVPWRLKRRGIG